MKKLALIPLAAVGIAFALALFSPSKTLPPSAPPEKPHVSGAGLALDNWYASRAYPSGKIDLAAWTEASQQYHLDASTAKTASTQWESMGPWNIGGRTLRLAFNPQNPNTLYAGSAAGGLWRSHTAGVGPFAWHHVATGFPVLGVAAIAVHPLDTNVIVIGTGELYNDGKTGDRVNIRLSRGTYGIGILRSSDNGQTWAKTLDWAYDDMRGVQDIAFNPQNPNSVLAATSEGIYQSLDAGLSWNLRLGVRMANDILFDPTDTSRVLVAVGNLGSTGRGIYRSLDGGATFTNASNGLPSFGGKITLSATSDAPVWVYASVADSLTGYGLNLSTDWGQTWVQSLPTDYQSYQGWYSHDVAVNPWNRNEIMCGGIDAWFTSTAGASVLHVSDWQTWYLNTTPPIGGPEGFSNYVHADIHHIIYHPTDSNKIYFATDGGIFRCTNGNTVFQGLNGMYQTTQFYADFSNSQQDSNLAIGGLQDNASAVYQGNKAWYRVIGGDGCCTAIDPFVDEVIYASTQYATIWSSNDRGVNFNYLNNQPPANNAAFVTSFALCPDAPLTIYSCSDFVGVSGDGGAFWTPTNGGFALNGNNVLRVAVPAGENCNMVYAAVAPGASGRSAVFKTTNGGAAWQNITGTLPDRYYHEFAVHPTNSDIVYVVLGGYGSDHVYKTTDGGASWFSVSTGLPNVPANTVAIDPANPDQVFVGNDVGVFYSNDGGASWAPLGTGLPDAVLAMDLSISPTNRKLRLATHGSGVYQVDLPGPALAEAEPAPALRQAMLSPNPASSSTRLQFSLSQKEKLTITLLDQSGKVLQTLSRDKEFGLGQHEIAVSVADLKSAVYFVRLETPRRQSTLRLAVLH